METSGASPPPVDKNAMLSKAVYDWIIEKSGGSVIIQEPVEILFGDVGNEFTMQHAFKVGQAYPAISLDVDALSIAMSGKLTSTSQKGNSATSARDSKIPMSTIERSFEAEFLGNVDEEFKAYLLDCWNVYTKYKSTMKYPFTTIVQSFGFGKSKLLYQLAAKTKHDDRMRVLYTCVRPSAASTGYPRQTEQLNEFFFPKNCTEELIEERLFVAFVYAMEHWADVGEQWIGLFSRPATNDQDASKRRSDAEVSEQLRAFGLTFKKSNPAVATMPNSGPIETGAETKAAAHPDGKMAGSHILIFAIDEARALLSLDAAAKKEAKKVDDSTTKYRLLRRALESANERIRVKYKTESGIFAVLVDTNSKIADFVPPLKYDPSYRPGEDESRSFELFHPFVLTHTMNIYSDDRKRHGAVVSSEDVTMSDAGETAVASCEDAAMDIHSASQDTVASSQVLTPEEKSIQDTISFCRDMVLRALRDEDLAWEDLVCLGRPLWRSVAPKDDNDRLHFGEKEKVGLVEYAGKKLMLGTDITNSAAFSKQTMNGVASVLCRLGLRPYSSSALASRVVADFMAVLSYANYSHDQYISSYFSDPILTFGAAQLWYIGTDVLAKHILPELAKLFNQEVLDTGGIGEAVARILLLLAMDKCADVQAKRISLSRFFSVTSFMKILRGPNVEFPRTAKLRLIEEALVGELDAKWANWWVGFSHFVQLPEEPTEDCLWYLLSRRAAGMFPRNQDGADLFIPIFTCDADGKSASVSMILVQVKNYENGFSNLTEAAKRLCPSNVFHSENGLSRLGSGDVLRVILGLRGRTTRRIYVKESCNAESGIDATENNERVLFMGGIESGPGSFVSGDVAEQLNMLLSPWWDTIKLMENDLELRNDDDSKSPHSVLDGNLVDIAKKPMLDLLNILKMREVGRKRHASENLLHEEKKSKVRDA